MRRWLRLISHGDVLLPLGLHFLQPFLFGRVPEGDAVPAHNIFSILHIAVFSAWFLPGRGKLPALLNGELFLLFRIFSGWFFREGEFMMLMNIFGIVVGLYLATQDHMPTWFCVLFACLLYTDIIFWVVFAIGNRKRISGKKRRGGGIDG